MGVKCFFIEPTDECRRALRRYVYSSDPGAKCPGVMGYHDAQNPLDVVARPFDRVEQVWPVVPDPKIPHYDARWPQQCEGCDYRFSEADEWQVFDRQIYIDKETSKQYTLDEAVPGMMWDAFWAPDCWKGPDGRSLVVVCPNGRQWNIDSQASNCTMKDDIGPADKAHRCWIRHGTPPLIFVDKNGRTCAAGAGSIQAGDYHGFLGMGGALPGHFT